MFQPGQLSGAERITASGQAMGTIDYMAPEQAESSRTVDIRADLYSLGCTLYKLLSGHAPFSGPKYQDQVNKLMAHAREPVPPIRKVRPDVPAELAAVLDRLLAKDPARAFCHAGGVGRSDRAVRRRQQAAGVSARARRSSAAPAAPAGDPAAAEASSTQSKRSPTSPASRDPLLPSPGVGEGPGVRGLGFRNSFLACGSEACCRRGFACPAGPLRGRRRRGLDPAGDHPLHQHQPRAGEDRAIRSEGQGGSEGGRRRRSRLPAVPDR